MQNSISEQVRAAALAQLDAAEAAREDILVQHIANGVVINSRTVQIDPEVVIAPGAVILAGTRKAESLLGLFSEWFVWRFPTMQPSAATKATANRHSHRPKAADKKVFSDGEERSTNHRFPQWPVLLRWGKTRPGRAAPLIDR